MSTKFQPLIARALITPEKTVDFNLSEWDLLIRQARRAGLLARLGDILEKNMGLVAVPAEVRNHIQSAQIYSRQFNLSLGWEIRCIKKALQDIDAPLVFLKGTAYVVANDVAAIGRVFTDVDILIPKLHLAAVERALLFAGWKSGYLEAYDQRYYREWMHEIPPLTHIQRQTTIDVHHNILPNTVRFCPDANKLLANIVKIPGENVWVLAPEDRVLHSATHLFHEGELEQGFRDLSDLDLLLKEFSIEEGFWDKLLQRAIELKQQIPLFYALRYTSLILQTSVPNEVLKASEEHIPGEITKKIMDALFLRALMPDHSSCDDQWTGLARWLLFIRAHWLRMPWYLLIPHLYRKSVMQLTGKSGH